ncbi:MAG: hypothetical protein WC595_05035 [Candidatus Nanoarchaeia archaeon]
MLDKKTFENIRKELKDFEQKREETIQTSRKTITLSKQIIYAVHRDDLATAGTLLKDIQALIKHLQTTRHHEIGISNVAFQEYVEAICYYEFVKNKKVPGFKELQVRVEDYLLGLCDLTGELGRKAVAYAIKNEHKKVLEVKDLVEEIYGEFLKLDLRDWDLRKKSDAIKWNLNKLEDMAFSLKMGGRINSEETKN